MKTLFRPGRLLGFTLIELMAVVAIISILASVAIPLVNKYLRKSKTTEAGLNLRKVYDGEVAYYIEERVDQAGLVRAKQFLSAGPTPSTPGVNKQPGNWEGNWALLKFAPDGNVLFSYQTVAAGTGTNAAFTARANGDIDGDGTTSLFERVGSVDSITGEVVGGGALFSLDELE